MLLRSALSFLARGKDDAQSEIRQARTLLASGNARGAIPLLQRHLEKTPHDVSALNDLASCLHDVGRVQEAYHYFDLAFAIDESDLPTLINRGRRLFESGQLAESFTPLSRAKIQQPFFAHTDSVYAGARFVMGDVELARRYALSAWVKRFDYLRFANCHLFYGAYADVDEDTVASEHAFWAATLAPAPDPATSPECDRILALAQRREKDRVRIAYWSPDIRNHAVRYFLRPLLGNHDRSQFEIVLLSDFPVLDEQTERMRGLCDHFIDVFPLQDAVLLHLLKSLQIDVLVECAGHSSYNRLNLLQNRVAKVQLSGLGYPPTTGLESIDGKFMDPHTVGPDPERLYAERPFLLPESFWCFDPADPVPLARPEPPSEASGQVTFGCIGNISKITGRMLGAWAKILEGVPNSRLLVRCLHFNDAAVAAQFIAQADAHGIERERLTLLGPMASLELFQAYNEIDVVLDTFPFNGGTTTCFATYMGVPVVTLAGRSLLSRMGASIMRNMGASELVTDTFEQYVEAATRVARDRHFLRTFRAEARERFKRSHLGDGLGFTRAFEAACRDALVAAASKNASDRARPSCLPERELVRRASDCLQWGQPEAAQRIVNLCLSTYPDSASAHILSTHAMTEKGRYSEAAEYLLSRLPVFQPGDRAAALINALRCLALSDRDDDLAEACRLADSAPTDSPLDRLHIRLYQCRARLRAPLAAAPHEKPVAAGQVDANILVVVPSEDDDTFARLEAAYRSLSLPTPNSRIEVMRCKPTRKSAAYREALSRADCNVIVWAQAYAIPRSQDLLLQLMAGLAHHDAVGLAGAKAWDRIDWREGANHQKAGSFLAPCNEVTTMLELHVLGQEESCLAPGMRVLDGSLVALRRQGFEGLADDLFLEDLENAATLLEEYACHVASAKGLSLAAHQALGIYIDPAIELPAQYLPDARWEIAQRLGLDPFLVEPGHSGTIGVPVHRIEDGLALQRIAFPPPLAVAGRITSA